MDRNKIIKKTEEKGKQIYEGYIQKIKIVEENTTLSETEKQKFYESLNLKINKELKKLKRKTNFREAMYDLTTFRSSDNQLLPLVIGQAGFLAFVLGCVGLGASPDMVSGQEVMNVLSSASVGLGTLAMAHSAAHTNYGGKDSLAESIATKHMYEGINTRIALEDVLEKLEEITNSKKSEKQM